MADIPRAADLPEGSIVADRFVAAMRQPYGSTRLGPAGISPAPWRATTGETWGHPYVDFLLADGAEVLRYGYGEETR